MSPQDAIDLLTLAARSATWSGASPELARELLEVVRSNAERERDELQRRLDDTGGLERHLAECVNTDPKPTPPVPVINLGPRSPADLADFEAPGPGVETVGRALGLWHVEQPLPTGDGQEVFPVALAACTSRSLREMLAARDLVGRQRYGTSLKTGNGRDMLRDAREELADAFLYLTGAALEAKAAGRITWVIENARESVEDAWSRLGGAE